MGKRELCSSRIRLCRLVRSVPLVLAGSQGDRRAAAGHGGARAEGVGRLRGRVIRRGTGDGLSQPRELMYGRTGAKRDQSRRAGQRNDSERRDGVDAGNRKEHQPRSHRRAVEGWCGCQRQGQQRRDGPSAGLPFQKASASGMVIGVCLDGYSHGSHRCGHWRLPDIGAPDGQLSERRVRANLVAACHG